MLTRPYRLATFLNYLLSDTNQTPIYLYYALFVDDLHQCAEKTEEKQVKWAKELSSTFLTLKSVTILSKVQFLNLIFFSTNSHCI